MKKLFLIPLMTLVCSVMVWANDAHVSNITDLKAAVANASVETIYLDADIDYAEASCINILRSVTIDGQGHTLSGYGRRASTSSYPTIAINQGGSSMVDVTLKNLQMINPLWRVVETRGNIHSLTIDNCHIEAQRLNTGDYDQPITIGGNQASQAAITIRNSKVVAAVYYPIITFNPVHLTLENTDIEGWCSVYFKGQSSSAGSRGSVLVADDCHFNAPNVYSGVSNAFGMFVCEDDGINITLNNCGMDAEHFGDQRQSILVLSNFAARRSQAVSLTINGDNTYINSTLLSDCWSSGMNSSGVTEKVAVPDPHPLSVTISGGTYMFNPQEAYWYKDYTLEEPDKSAEENKGRIVIPAGYEVKEITTQQGGLQTTLWRVRKEITTAYSINDNVEGEGAGQNEHTEFLISGDEAVAAESTIANYVEVSNNATLTLPAGKELVVTNGLDVTDGASVDVKAGSTLIVGQGGVTSENVESIVIEADENGSASFLLSPDVIVNTTPNLTVKMTAKVGYSMILGEKDYSWHRFSMPVDHIDSWAHTKAGDVNVPTALQQWNYSTNSWASATISQMVPYRGYALTYDEPLGTEVTYLFQGRLCGNIDKDLLFNAKGYNFFGNSYTGYIAAHILLADVVEDPNIGGSIYMWNTDDETYYPVSLRDLSNPATRAGLEDWEKEIAPMQTFVLQLRGNNDPNVKIDYSSAIWGNPRYGNGASPAPARRMDNSNDDNAVKVIITAANGKRDIIRFVENSELTDAYDNGADADKMMHTNRLNIYSTVDNNNYAILATDNLIGKTITLNTAADINYTMTFSNVSGTVYGIKDTRTNVITPMNNGNIYNFVAQSNSIDADRFVIVPIQSMPTDLEENISEKAAQKGIYSLMGQYMGEDFSILPAGVYVVDGVKIVK